MYLFKLKYTAAACKVRKKWMITYVPFYTGRTKQASTKEENRMGKTDHRDAN